MLEPQFLKNKNLHELDTHITFDEGPHIYTIDGDSDYTSVTTWNHSHFWPFNADMIIDKMMSSPKWPNNTKYFGMSKDEIKSLWDKNRDEAAAAGTKMHYDIECFYNKMDVKNESIEFKYFNNFYSKYKYLKAYRTEWMIYDKELKLAGSIDMIFENQDGNLEIYDWKRCKEIKKDNAWGKAKTPCINHLPDTNFWHYSLQLNTYKAIIEKNYGKKVVNMCLVCLHPENKNNDFLRFEVPDLSSEIKALFEYRLLEIKDKRQLDINNLKHEKGKLLEKIEKNQIAFSKLNNKLRILNLKLYELNNLHDSESELENEVEVEEKKYNDKIYLVDTKTNEILDELGNILGKWEQNIPIISSI